MIKRGVARYNWQTGKWEEHPQTGSIAVALNLGPSNLFSVVPPGPFPVTPVLRADVGTVDNSFAESGLRQTSLGKTCSKSC